MIAEQTQPYADAYRLVQVLAGQWQARLIETHLSWVLLDGVWAWKFKKPVRLPFLDCSALQRRRRLCEQELSLNRRLAPSLYLDVLPVCGTVDAPQIDGTGQIIEYVLRMKQFEPGALACERLRAGTLMPEHIDRLALRLAHFHRSAARADSDWGSPARIVQTTKSVLAGLSEQYKGQADIAARIDALAAWCDEQSRHLHDTWLHRWQHGHVIEGHGDLHLANVVLLSDEDVTAFDCLEFDPALRWIDRIHDIAFLIMDLMAHGRSDLAWYGLNQYLDACGDHEGVAVLRYYMVGRALVRAMVAGLPGGQHAHASAPDYLDLAQRLAEATGPLGGPALLITHGLSGSGKSWQTAQLMALAGAIRLRSDVVRHQLGQDVSQRYSDAGREATYARLLELAELVLRAGYPVIIDATFLHSAQRREFGMLAAAMNVPFNILHCQAPQAVLAQRIGTRRAQGQDASEADEQVLRVQIQAVQALSAAEQACTIRLDSMQSQPLQDLLAQWVVKTRETHPCR